jgi:hypothetical protein
MSRSRGRAARTRCSLIAPAERVRRTCTSIARPASLSPAKDRPVHTPRGTSGTRLHHMDASSLVRSRPARVRFAMPLELLCVALWAPMTQKTTLPAPILVLNTPGHRTRTGRRGEEGARAIFRLRWTTKRTDAAGRRLWSSSAAKVARRRGWSTRRRRRPWATPRRRLRRFRCRVGRRRIRACCPRRTSLSPQAARRAAGDAPARGV